MSLKPIQSLARVQWGRCLAGKDAPGLVDCYSNGERGGLGFHFCTCLTRTCHVAVSDFSTQLTSVSIPNTRHCESAVGYCAFCYVNFFPLCIFVTFFLRLKILKSQPFVYYSSHNKNKNMVLLEKD